MSDVNIFKFLLEKAEDKNPTLRRDKKWTMLHDLAGKGHLEMCRLMVKAVEDKSPYDVDGSTPYHIAAYFGLKEVCRLLMEYHMNQHRIVFATHLYILLLLMVILKYVSF